MTPGACLKFILNRLGLLTLIFHGVVALNIWWSIPAPTLELFKSAATLTLGAYLTIIKDIASDKEDELEKPKKPEGFS